MKKEIVFGIIITFILLANPGFYLVTAVQITITDNNKDIESYNVAVATGLYQTANGGWHFQNDAATLNAMCFYSNYSNNPAVQNKKIISGIYSSGAYNHQITGELNECLLIWNNNAWTKKCFEGGNFVKHDTFCNVEFTDHPNCNSFFLSEDFSTNPSLNSNWTIYRYGSGASTSNTAVWENSQFTLTKNAAQVEGGLDFTGQLTNNTWEVEFDFKITEQTDCADGIYLYFDKYNSANVKIGNFGVEYDIFKNPSSDVLIGTTSPPHAGCDGNGCNSNDKGAIAIIEGIRDTADYKHFNFSNQEISCNYFTTSGSYKNTKIVFYNGNITVYLSGIKTVSYYLGNNFDYLKLRILGDTGADYSLQKIDNLKINTSICRSLTCADYMGRCGSSLSDGLGQTLDCSNNCPNGQQCNNGMCENVVVQPSSCPSNQIIMKLSGDTNAHGALWDDADYPVNVCYKDIFGSDYSGTSPHDCAQNNGNKVMGLASITSSHAEIPSLDNYPNNVCYGNLVCRAVDTASSSINSGLLAYYPLEGNANDLSGNLDNGVINGATFGTGKIGQAASFDGIDNYISSSDKDYYTPTSSGFSVSAWVYLRSIEVGGGQSRATVISKSPKEYASGNQWEWSLLAMDLYHDDGNAPWAFDTWSPSGGELSYAVDSSDAQKNVWTHLVATVDSTGASRLYVNGVLKATGPSATFPTNLNQPVRIGTHLSYLNFINEWNFDGMIDDARIWNRALTANEISTLYNPCSINEKLIASLVSDTNAHIASDNSYPIKICCKEGTGQISFEKMNGVAIAAGDSVDVGDSVRLSVTSTGITDQLVNYTVYKERAFWWDKKIAQFSNKAFTVWRANETGEDFYFKAYIDNEFLGESGKIKVVGPANDVSPEIRIVNPVLRSNYTINPLTSQTNNISFEQVSKDEDDDLNILWDFGDSQTVRLTDCLSGVNCNTTHNYSSSGTKIITAKAEEKYRSKSVINYTLAFVYKEGLNIFAIIDKPNYIGVLQEPGLYELDGRSSHIANCSFSPDACNEAAGTGKTCYDVVDAVNPSSVLYCYRFLESNLLTFQWTIDNVVSTHTNNEPFYHMFKQSGEHYIRLRVSYAL